MMPTAGSNTTRPTQTVEMHIGREMPTLGGSTDPEDFDHNEGILDGDMPYLLPAIEYPERTAISFDEGTVTVLIKKDDAPLMPIIFKIRAEEVAESLIEAWSVTVGGNLYVPTYVGSDEWFFNFDGDLGEWEVRLFYVNDGDPPSMAAATGPQSIDRDGEYSTVSIPEGSVGLFAIGGGEIEQFSQVYITVTSPALMYYLYVNLTVYESGSAEQSRIVILSPNYPDEGTLYLSVVIADLDIGENWIELDETIPADAEVKIIMGADKHECFAVSEIRLTPTMG